MRARNIKPGFFKNEELAECSPWARLLFIGLWCMADCEGRLEKRPKRIKAEIFPYDSLDINGELTVLEQLGFIQSYQVCGVDYILIIHFKEHQRPHHTEARSKLPDISEGCALTTNPPLNNGEYPPDSLIYGFSDSLIPDSLIDDQDEKTEPEEPEEPDGFSTFWAEYPKKKAKADARKAWRQISPPIKDVMESLDWQKQQPDWEKENGKYVPLPASWIRGRRWEDEPDELPETTDNAGYHPPNLLDDAIRYVTNKNKKTQSPEHNGHIDGAPQGQTELTRDYLVNELGWNVGY